MIEQIKDLFATIRFLANLALNDDVVITKLHAQAELNEPMRATGSVEDKNGKHWPTVELGAFNKYSITVKYYYKSRLTDDDKKRLQLKGEDND